MAIHTADRNTFHDMISTDFVIVDFYGSTCTPCKVFSKILEDIEAEIPFFEHCQAKYHGQPRNRYGVPDFRRPHHSVLQGRKAPGVPRGRNAARRGQGGCGTVYV